MQIVQLLWKTLLISYKHIMWPSNPSRYLSKKNKNLWSHKNMYMNVYTNSITTIQETTHMSLNKCMHKQTWFIHIMDIHYTYNRAIKRNELIYITACINLAGIVLNERGQSQKVT